MAEQLTRGETAVGAKACPFCEAEPVVRRERLFAAVYCADAECVGPSVTATLLDEAVRRWNRRSESQS